MKSRQTFSTQGFEPLLPEDIAEAVIWSLERPPHVNIQEMVVFPTAQVGVGATCIHREHGQAAVK